MTAWAIEFTAKAEKQFGKLDRQAQIAIVNYLEKVLNTSDPRDFGKALLGDLSGFWRYRVGKYRIICDIQEKRLIIEVISVGKRGSVYK